MSWGGNPKMDGLAKNHRDAKTSAGGVSYPLVPLIICYKNSTKGTLTMLSQQTKHLHSATAFRITHIRSILDLAEYAILEFECYRSLLGDIFSAPTEIVDTLKEDWKSRWKEANIAIEEKKYKEAV